MRTPEKNIKEGLWRMVRNQVMMPVSLFVGPPGIKPDKGQTKQEALIEALEECFRNVYEAGLDRGYDMGYEVGAGDGLGHEED